jgi:hypothetical protein
MGLGSSWNGLLMTGVCGSKQCFVYFGLELFATMSFGNERANQGLDLTSA